MNPEKDLITLCQQHGITITEKDVPEILELGVDTFLSRRGIDLPVKYLDAFYLILDTLKNKKQTL